MGEKLISFTHQDRQLQVSAVAVSEGWKVRVIENDKPVTGIVYSVLHETNISAKMQGFPEDLVEELMQLAQTDVEQGRVSLICREAEK